MEKEIENIFSYAVALDQTGKQKNTILCRDREIYMINFDKTILLHFDLPKSCSSFNEEIVFDANDYDSSNFYIENHSIVFKIVKDGYVRKKICGTNKTVNLNEISELYQSYIEKKITSNFTLRQEINGLLQDDLSHVEIHYDKGLKIVQRDIFSGTIIEITKDKSGLNLTASGDKLTPFEPMGLRTIDLDALFNYDREISFSFVPNLNYFIIKGKTTGMQGILAWCLYDELGRINVIETE